MFQPVHVDSRTALNRPNLLPTSSSDGAAGSPRSAPAAQSDAGGKASVADRWLPALRDEPAVRTAAIDAARAELTSGRLLTRVAAEETAAALLNEAIPD